MQTLSEIKSLLESRGLRPKRSLGQNFLADQNLIRKLVEAAAVKPGDIVVEVGPGTGTLTEELLSRGDIVVSCELDDGLADLLRERLGSQPGFTLVHGDCLADKRTLNRDILDRLGGRAFSLVANLPYGAATPLISTLLVHHPECHTIAVTIQKELADRLMAKPGTKDYGPISIIAQTLCSIERVAKAPPECFWPRPEVSSTLVLMRRRKDPLTDDPQGLSEFCARVFAHRRKQLGAVLKGVDWEAVDRSLGCGTIRPTLRAEQLTPEQVIALGRTVHDSSKGPSTPSR